MSVQRPKTAAEIREAFLQFFEARGHTRVPSSPLVPVGDDTLLFTNAGMVQFKNTFLGLEKRPYLRATSSQKCMRVSGKHNDLEEVGPSPRHHTFFEMLGNFSFGDYFKRDAIHYAWECLTQLYGIPPDRLVVTVFHDDDEAFRVWHEEIGLPAERIMRMGEKTNFWSMGDTGPCGPTSELHYDWGPQACTCGRPDCSVALDNGCGRWLEVWNLVFMQFNQAADGTRTRLPQPGVDTGMGLERLVSVLQNAPSNYDTDLFLPIMARLQQLAGHSDAQRRARYVPYRAIADHSRAMAFLIADGVLPGNEGRSYILRLILRRAARFGRLLGFQEPFLARVAETVIESMGDAYPELRERRDFILRNIELEEERFLRTLDIGLSLLDGLVQRLKAEGGTVLPGVEAFRLWDTYGFPLDLTRDLAAEHGLTVDMAGYREALEEQRQRARAAAQFGAVTERDLSPYLAVLNRLPDRSVDHVYLSGGQASSYVAALLVDGKPVDQATAGQAVEVVLPTTPFYVEAGGQVSDTGKIVQEAAQPAWEVEVTDMARPVPGLITHVGVVKHGAVRVGDAARAEVDMERRFDIMRNHTATHILHAELRYILGTHVHQAGSLVAPDRLRFDFTHPTMLREEELRLIEQSVNDAILADYPVRARWSGYREALAEGAMALFSEKYGDVVRVVEIGEPGNVWSKELCGGTHVDSTAQIGIFHIVSEGSVGSNARRIEAVTGRAAYELIQDRLNRLQRAASFLGVPETEVDRKVLGLLDQVSTQQKEIAHLREELARYEFEALKQRVVHVDGVEVLAAQVAAADMNTMRQMTDWFRDQMGSGVVVLGAAIAGKPNFVAAVTPDLVARGLHAGELVKAVAQRVGGSGGGKPTLAQAGGRDLAGMRSALAEVPALVKKQLAGQKSR
ncbi:MAG: alanine--tRNA ligase [Caldilineales bacterium]|nr:alanine--tRNA ligase [Caldilineales bacterium]